MEREIAERSTRVHGLRAQRQPLVEGLYKDIRERYDILLQRKGSAVAALDGDRCCTRCRIRAAAQQLTEIERGRLQTCRGCGRWLTA